MADPVPAIFAPGSGNSAETCTQKKEIKTGFRINTQYSGLGGVDGALLQPKIPHSR